MSVAVDRAVSLLAKVDTGAANCIFQREYAEALGLTVEDGLSKRFSTATGTFSAFGHNVKLSCFDLEFDSTVYFATQYEFPRNVLGLEGWLDRLRFGLVHYDRTVFLSHYDE